MRNKYYFMLVFLITILFVFAACGTEGDEKVIESEAYVEKFFGDNSKPLSDILTKTYDLQELRSFFGISSKVIGNFEDEEESKTITIGDANQKFPVECLREDCYTVYKVKEGGYFYVFWLDPTDSVFDPATGEYDFTNKVADSIMSFNAYILSPKKASDFDSIKEGMSTAEDVFKVDPAVEISFMLSNGIYSYSLLDDGTMMQIAYYHNKEVKVKADLIVIGKSVISKELASSGLSSILPNDLP